MHCVSLLSAISDGRYNTRGRKCKHSKFTVKRWLASFLRRFYFHGSDKAAYDGFAVFHRARLIRLSEMAHCPTMGLPYDPLPLWTPLIMGHTYRCIPDALFATTMQLSPLSAYGWWSGTYNFKSCSSSHNWLWDFSIYFRGHSEL